MKQTLDVNDSSELLLSDSKNGDGGIEVFYRARRSSSKDI